MTFIEKLSRAWDTHNSLLCVGLDPDLGKLPAHLLGRPDAIFAFCKAIIDATADTVCAYKPQIAYFAAARAEDQLEAVCEYLRTTYPHIPLVLDAKRGDIGATAYQYAREAFERYGADAVTVNPYMGFDSVEPYLEWKERGVVRPHLVPLKKLSDAVRVNRRGSPMRYLEAILILGGAVLVLGLILGQTKTRGRFGLGLIHGAACPRCGKPGLLREATGWCGPCSNPGSPKKPPRECPALRSALFAAAAWACAWL